MKAGLAVLTAILAVACLAGFLCFQALAPDAYMDEIFHVPQTQRYCAGLWKEWDDKITTFPGLYLLGVTFGRVHHALAAALGRQVELCGTAPLRAVNAMLAVACAPLLYWLARATDPSRTGPQAVMLAATLALFPLHFFFAFLYYTDVASAFFTMAAYLTTKQRRAGAAAALAAAAVLMRQTNAVWVAFMAGEALLERCQPALTGAAAAKKDGSSGSGGPGSSNGSSNGRSSGQMGAGGSTRSSSEGFGAEAAAAVSGAFSELVRVALQAWTLRWELLCQLWGHAAVAAAFAAFVVWNGGVVVGDKANHAPVRHLVQPLYFALYATLCLAAVFLAPDALKCGLGAAARSGAAARLGAAAAIVAAGLVVRHGTLVHPFLLADNRHYVFYLWRRVLSRWWWVRYALAPAYVAAAAALAAATSHRGRLWQALFALSTCLVLVPAHLIEFRYFTAPFFFLALNMRTPSVRQLAAVAAAYAAVNCVVAGVYLGRPFTWPDGSVARFLW